MEIRIRATGAVVTEREFRAMHPNTSFPTVLAADVLDSVDADAVLEGAQPTPTRYQTVYRDGVEQVGGKWYTKYTVLTMDQAAQTALDARQADAVRATRNQLLKESDWTQLADTPGQTRAAYVQYRQDLRNVPQQAGFPWSITWPTQP